MIQAIMNIVEWLLVLFVLWMAVYPYIAYFHSERTFKGILVENGAGYLIVLASKLHKQFVEIVATLAIVAFLAACFPKFAYAVAIWFFQVAVVCHTALKAGHEPYVTEIG
ncbi:hypothetical protein PA10_00119 [Pseudomonas phage pPa_SNUABM_DT01]|nr:hypothetical protein PA10_00119 [Pseudomonas phage pPa_SNUABM_DT01]